MRNETIQGGTFSTEDIYFASYLKASGTTFIKLVPGKETTMGTFYDFVFEDTGEIDTLRTFYIDNDWFCSVGPRDITETILFFRRLIREERRSKRR